MRCRNRTGTAEKEYWHRDAVIVAKWVTPVVSAIREGKGEARVNPVVASGFGALNHTCFRCGEKGHLARNCQKPPRRKENGDNYKAPGNESRRTEPPDRRLHSIGCINENSVITSRWS